MSYSRDDIKYMAMCELGRRDRPNFIADKDEDVAYINFMYDQVMEGILQSYNWGWCRQYAELLEREDVEPGVGRYKYNYKLPKDFLYLNNKYSDVSYKMPIADFDLNWIDQMINTNSQKCFIEYVRNVEEKKYPAYFVDYVKLKLAFELCMKLTGDTDLMQILDKRTTEESFKAKNTDARQQRTKVIRTQPYISVRY